MTESVRGREEREGSGEGGEEEGWGKGVKRRDWGGEKEGGEGGGGEGGEHF